MIIVIGKKDKALMLDAQAYVFQCGKSFYINGHTPYDDAKSYDKDCTRIANRILKVLGYKYRH